MALDNLAGCARIFKVVVGVDGSGQAMRLAAHAGNAGFCVASPDGLWLGLTSEVFQFGALRLGVPSEDVELAGGFFLSEGPDGKRAGQRGGGS